MRRDLKVHASLHDYGNCIELYVVRDHASGREVGTLAMREIGDGYVTEPTMRIDKTAAQFLMDQLWRCGLRPTEGSGSAGAFAAQGRHLEDMRALVFKSSKP